MNQNAFLEILSQGLIQLITAQESVASKGKPLESNRTVWILQITLSNGNESLLLSSRGSRREWASLDTLSEWLKTNEVSNFQISHMEVEEQ